MRKTLALLAAASAITIAAPAFAQNFGGPNAGAWLSIDQRQANLDARIDAGVRRGALTPAEAAALRTEFRALASLEAAYRSTGGGIDANERRDLDARFDALSLRIRDQATDSDRGGGFPPAPGWQTVQQRAGGLEAQIAAGVRNRTLTAAEATELRNRVRNLVALEARYSAGGLDNAERRELDDRFDNLADMIREQASDIPPVPWQTIQQRAGGLEAQIAAGVRNRTLTAAEAAELRNRVRTLVQLEARYSAGGLDNAERRELNDRFDNLADMIREWASDGVGTGGPIWAQPLPGWTYGGWVINGRWQTINERQAELNRRIDYGQRIGRLSQREVASLRTEFNAIVRLEANYRRNGLTAAERNDLDRRFNILAGRLQVETWDNNNGRGPGFGRGPWN